MRRYEHFFVVASVYKRLVEKEVGYDLQMVGEGPVAPAPRKGTVARGAHLHIVVQVFATVR
jgi:hypothetical protein